MEGALSSGRTGRSKHRTILFVVTRRVIIAGLLGAVVGAAVAAYVDSTHVFVCNDSNFQAACAGESVLIPLAWGSAIGMVLGIAIGYVVSRRGHRGPA